LKKMLVHYYKNEFAGLTMLIKARQYLVSSCGNNGLFTFKHSS